MKNITTPLFCLFLLFIVGCNAPKTETPTPENTSTESAITTPSAPETGTPPTDTIQTSNTNVTNKQKKYNGSWFTVSYPASFTAQPLSPTGSIDDFHHVVTDEAFFTAADGSVQFFVYSPQWGGDPLSYLEQAKNEITESDKTDAEEVMPSNIHRWVTFKAKDGSYTRSFYSKQTESTHLVFGIKYTDQAAYDKHLAQYKAFKASLEQFAD